MAASGSLNMIIAKTHTLLCISVAFELVNWVTGT